MEHLFSDTSITSSIATRRSKCWFNFYFNLDQFLRKFPLFKLSYLSKIIWGVLEIRITTIALNCTIIKCHALLKIWLLSFFSLFHKFHRTYKILIGGNHLERFFLQLKLQRFHIDSLEKIYKYVTLKQFYLLNLRKENQLKKIQMKYARLQACLSISQGNRPNLISLRWSNMSERQITLPSSQQGLQRSLMCNTSATTK